MSLTETCFCSRLYGRRSLELLVGSFVLQRPKNQSLYHEILFLQKFNDRRGKVLKPKKSLQHKKKMRPFFISLIVSDCMVWIRNFCLMQHVSNRLNFQSFKLDNLDLEKYITFNLIFQTWFFKNQVQINKGRGLVMSS